ncbi:MAG: carotenoid biosynthesis protein [Spirochaetales bacterium]|nr:carotenoid biosynthesis protein [Spirochaetales bacterium]
MQNLQKTERLILLLLVPFYAIGVLLHTLDATLPMMLAFTPYTILATSILGFFFEVRARNTKVLGWAVITFQSTLVLEIVGVATSLVFGAYTYGSTLGLKLFGVTLLIGINWTIIILGIVQVAGKHLANPYLAALVTASLTVLFDYVMEPVAIAFDYWTWAGGAIPLQNYLAWFCIAFVFAFLFAKQKLAAVNRVPTLIVIVQFAFFVGLRVFAL